MNDNYGRVAALRPADTNEAALYAVPAGMEFVGLLSVCNQDSGAQTFSAALTDAAGAATGEDWLASAEPIAAYTRTAIRVFLDEAQTIRVVASVGDKISFLLMGLLIDNR